MTPLPAQDKRAALRRLCRTDLYFLLRYGLNRPDVEKQWLFDRCREVQARPNEMLDLWSREHYKSTIITFAKTIQDILATHGDGAMGREETFGIFSHTRPIAKAFLRQIKQEMESNQFLLDTFPDVLWSHPHRDAPKWSEDDGLIVKRKGNPKESTIEAWGLVDAQPTSKHFTKLVYDDVVVPASVTSPEMIGKVTAAMELSYNLGTDGGARRMVGTRYHFNDTYRTVLERGTVTPRVRLATSDGTMDGELALWTRERLVEKRRDMGPYTFSCQIMQNPKADESQGFQEGWLQYYDRCNRANMNVYLLVDAANGKRPTNDYTSMWALGLGPDKYFYVLDMVRDRLNLTQRAAKLIDMHRRWEPIDTRYEEYGMQADIQHIRTEQERQTYRFNITQVGGRTPKPDRIKRLIPRFEQGRILLPRKLHYTDHQGVTRDLVRDFIEEEFKAFPVPLHDDMMDSLARIEEPDLQLVWPEGREAEPLPSHANAGGGWTWT